MTDLITLKACPFCGGEACEWEDENSFAVYCTTCGVEVTHTVSAEYAVCHWNRRRG